MTRSTGPTETPCIALHGGAGTIPAAALKPADRAAYHAALRAALQAGWEVLAKGGAALDAIAAAIVKLEDDTLFNAGRGAVFTADERLEMDAAIMDGSTRQCGAVAGICGPQNPILGARLVMEHSGNVLLIGKGAEDFLREQGVTFCPEKYFETENRRAALRLEMARRAAGAPDTRSDADRHGTVGAVARDRQGRLAAGTSTGGITGKRPGRVGDTPIFGAGTFADNHSCAVSATGTGEVFVRFTAASEIAARVKYAGQSLPQAVAEVVELLRENGGDGGLVAIGAKGPPVLAFNGAGMYRGFAGPEGGLFTAIHQEAYLCSD